MFPFVRGHSFSLPFFSLPVTGALFVDDSLSSFPYVVPPQTFVAHLRKCRRVYFFSSAAPPRRPRRPLYSCPLPLHFLSQGNLFDFFLCLTPTVSQTCLTVPPVSPFLPGTPFFFRTDSVGAQPVPLFCLLVLLSGQTFRVLLWRRFFSCTKIAGLWTHSDVCRNGTFFPFLTIWFFSRRDFARPGQPPPFLPFNPPPRMLCSFDNSKD